MSRCAGGLGGWIGWWKRIWIEVRITMYELRIGEEWRALPAGMSRELRRSCGGVAEELKKRNAPQGRLRSALNPFAGA